MGSLTDGVVLDGKTGRPESDDAGPRLLNVYTNPASDLERELYRAPHHVKANLTKAAEDEGHVRAAYGYEDVLYAPVNDGTAITAAAETIMVPDYTFEPNYMYGGRVLQYSLWFRWSSVITTPGTQTFRLRWGGVGGVSMAASGAYAPDPTAASTNITGYVEWLVVQRTSGTAGTSMTMGKMWLNDFDDASLATTLGNLQMHVIPTSAPAVATVDTTTTKALSPTYQSSVATGSLTTHMAILESLN